MFDRQFFSSKLGKAAIISLAAMAAFNILAFSSQSEVQPRVQIQPAPFELILQSVELA